jgi:hypothetical protein
MSAGVMSRYSGLQRCSSLRRLFGAQRGSSDRDRTEQREGESS